MPRFARFRFAGGRWAGAGLEAEPAPPVVTPTLRDDAAAFLDIEARLIALGVFDEVVLGARPDDREIGASHTAAYIWRGDWVETGETTERLDDHEDIIREVVFHVAIWTRAQTYRQGFLRQ